MPQLTHHTLTERFVASIRPTTSRKSYFDEKVRGLALRVTPTGHKSWAYVYRATGKSNWITLGAYPAMGLPTARTKAGDLAHSVHVRKENPVVAHRAATALARKGAATFGEFAPTFVLWQKGRVKTWRDDQAKIATYLLPAWESVLLTEIKRPQVHALLDTLVQQGMTVGVNRIQALISHMFTLALDRSLVDAHPVARMIKRFKETPRDHTLSDEDLKALWLGLDAQPGPAADAVRLRLLLGQRMVEQIMPMEWAEIDLKANLWVVPAARMKNGKPHAVPLPKTVHAILTRRHCEVPDGEPRVFPGLRSGQDAYRNLSTLPKALGFQWTDLRRTFTSRLAELGVSEEIRRRILSHARATVQDRHYNKFEHMPEKRAALDLWDKTLAAIVTT